MGVGTKSEKWQISGEMSFLPGRSVRIYSLSPGEEEFL